VFKEILQIIPKLSPNDLNNMERSLSTRFGRIAKKFGKGLAASLAGGGIAGLALGLIDKLLNPLKETQEAIDRVLKQGDDIVTNAKQFGTTAGKLFRLQQLAKSTGLDEGSLDILLQKFQTAVAEAAADPKKQTSVRQFVGEKDSAEAFFSFIQSLQRLDKNQQVLVQQEVFGEKQILKMADFLQTDFAKQAKVVGGPSSDELQPGLEKIGALNDLKDALEARRTLQDTMRKGRLLNEGMIRSQDAREKLTLEQENKRIQSYDNLASISEASIRLQTLMEQGIALVGGLVTKVTDLAANVKKLTESRAAKGLMKLLGGG
jgi:hypothetical protein